MVAPCFLFSYWAALYDPPGDAEHSDDLNNRKPVSSRFCCLDSSMGLSICRNETKIEIPNLREAFVASTRQDSLRPFVCVSVTEHLKVVQRAHMPWNGDSKAIMSFAMKTAFDEVHV